MALTGMLAEVTRSRVKGLLLERDPDLLSSALPADVAAFEALVKGAAVQVALLVGEDPPAGRVRGLAVETVAVQTASEIEYATFPEQQGVGDVGRGYHLHQRYLELLGELRRIMDATGGTVPEGDDPLPTTTVGRARGRFPEPSRYPDPVRVRGAWPC